MLVGLWHGPVPKERPVTGHLLLRKTRPAISGWQNTVSWDATAFEREFTALPAVNAFLSGANGDRKMDSLCLACGSYDGDGGYWYAVATVKPASPGVGRNSGALVRNSCGCAKASEAKLGRRHAQLPFCQAFAVPRRGTCDPACGGCGSCCVYLVRYDCRESLRTIFPARPPCRNTAFPKPSLQITRAAPVNGRPCHSSCSQGGLAPLRDTVTAATRAP